VIYCAYRKDHEKCEFEVHEVYAVDVLVSTGDGKVYFSSKSSDVHCTRFFVSCSNIYRVVHDQFCMFSTRFLHVGPVAKSQYAIFSE